MMEKKSSVGICTRFLGVFCVISVAAALCVAHSGWAVAVDQETPPAQATTPLPTVPEKPKGPDQSEATKPEPPAATQAAPTKEAQPTLSVEGGTPSAKPGETPAVVPVEPKKETEEQKAAPAQESKKEEQEKKDSKESDALSNQACMECHNKDILGMSKEDLLDQVVVEGKPAPPRQRPPFVFGELNLAIDQKKYEEGVHADTTCISCHADIKDLPHNQRLKAVDCKECHEDFVANVEKSAHGSKSGKQSPGCIGCHNVHYGQGKETYEKDFQRKVCLDCHQAYKMDTIKGHAALYEPRMHVALDCMLCHHGKEKGVHNIPLVKTYVVACDACHQKYTVLAKEKIKPTDFFTYITMTSFINKDVMKRFGYVIGANRIPALDTLVILAVLAPLGLPVVHGGLRFITRRKGPIHLPTEKILLHPLIERLWHWVQALCIIMLIITGIIIHWPERFPGWFQWAVSVHNWFGVATVVAFIVWLIYNLATGRIKHYIPRRGEIPGGMIRQARFYAYGIFKHEPHPYAPTEDNKFNPLQKIAYLQFQVFLLPLLLISGILYMYPDTFRGVINAIGGVWVLSIIHYLLGALFAAFLMAHLYLATTGETIGENFKAMIFGYGLKADHDDHNKA
ncbi:MAG: cytochrome b/b6 domain-containing protein [Desulfomonilaceae bacterium]